MFTYNKEKPRLLGKKTLEGDLVYYPTKTNKEELKDTVKYLEIKNWLNIFKLYFQIIFL